MFGNKDLQILFHMSRGENTVAGLSESMGISVPEIYRKIRTLRSMDVIEGKDPIIIGRCPFARRLMALMSEGPGMAKYLSGSSLDVLIAIVRPRDLKDIAKDTGLSESHVRKILKIQMEGRLVRKIDDMYSINDPDCPKLRSFINSYTDYLEVSDPRVSRSSEIIFRKGKDVVFSSSDSQGFRPTGITAFKGFGMKGIPDGYGYYSTASGEFNIETVFDDAVRIAEAENNWRLRMFNELFYIKNKKRLKPSADFIENHKRIMSGEHIERWPSRKDLEDRMWMVGG